MYRVFKMNIEFSLDSLDIKKLVSDKKAFSDFVYTPIEDVVNELTHRWEDISLENRVNAYLNSDIPGPLINGYKAIIFRHICTSSYEVDRYINSAKQLGLDLVFGEYHQDKFTSNNMIKYCLGKIPLHAGVGRNGGAKISYENIFDFNFSDGKKFSSIRTDWGQSLISFHHELFFNRYPNIDASKFYDASAWFERNGAMSKYYYNKFLALFIRNGVLFENFSINDKEERRFTIEYFLPAFIRVFKELSVKPLIVDLAPMDIDGDIYWLSHKAVELEYIEKKRKLGYNYRYGTEHVS